MKKSQLLSASASAVIVMLMFVPAGCGKKSSPVIPSSPGAVSRPAASEIPPPAAPEIPSQPSGKISKPPAGKTNNLQLYVTAELNGRNVRGGFTLPGNMVNKSLTFNWNAILNATDYKVTVLTHRLSTRTDSVAIITPLEVFTGNETSFTIPEVHPLKQYSFTVTAYGEDGNVIREENVSFRTERMARPVALEDIYFNSSNTTTAEMRKAGKTVTVPVWKLDKNGKKYGSTVNVTVHRAIADLVLTIFTEIYNGPDRFPIYEAGGFRDGSGDHAMGLAIDINANENMYVSGDGKRTTGKLWEPYKNPYSITPYGDVVTAFERHGFGWGGDSWSNVDYMHFFFLLDSFPTYSERMAQYKESPFFALLAPLLQELDASGGMADPARKPAVRQGVIPQSANDRASDQQPPGGISGAIPQDTDDNTARGGSDIPEYKFDDVFEAELRERQASGGRASLNNFSNQLMSQGTRVLDNDPDTAIDFLRKAVKANPGNQRAHAWLVYILLAHNRTDEAQTAIGQASYAGFSLNNLSGVNTRLSGLLTRGR